MSSPLKLFKRRVQNIDKQTVVFDPKNYSVQFEEVLQVDEARSNFFKYMIHVSDCEEIVMFLNDFEQLKEEYKLKTVRKRTLFRTEKRDAILQTNINYLHNNHRAFYKKHVESFNLNLSSILIQKTKEMNDELEGLIQSNMRRVSSLPSLEEKEPRSTTSSKTNRILQILNPEIIYGGIRLSIMHDLMQDQFPRYLVSNELREFLLEQGEEFTRRIAISNEKGKLDFRMKSNDFKGDEITPRYIYGAFALSEATDCWDLVYETEEPSSISTYLSNTDFTIGKHDTVGLKCYKHVFNLDMERDFIFALYSSMESRTKLNLEEHTQILGFKSGVSNNTLSCTKSKTTISFEYAGIKMKDRVVYTSNAVVYDAELDCIITIHKSYEDNNEYDQSDENEVRAGGLVVRFFYRLGPNLTRLVVIIYSDMKFPLQHAMFSSMMCKRRAKNLRRALLDVAPLYFEKWLEYKYSHLALSTSDNLGDYINVDKMFRISEGDDYLSYRSLQENIRTFSSCSWYKSYREKKDA